MKKLISTLLILTLCFSLAACSSKNDNSAKESADTVTSVPVPVSEDTQEKAETDTDIEINPDGLCFETVDIDGHTVTSNIIKNAKVIMVNFWEPWCGPCVGEMPGLEELYKKYEGDGLLILGFYFDTDCKDEAADIQNELGITYPLLEGCSELIKYTTDYVPTSHFFDAAGNPLNDEPLIGALDELEWEKMIRNYLGM